MQSRSRRGRSTTSSCFASEAGASLTRMSDDVAHTRWWQIFEVVFGVPVVIAGVLQLAVPLALPRAFLTTARVVGAALVVCGVALVVLARRELARRGQPTDPGQPTSALVTSGVSAISRNPLYLGGVLVLCGVAMALNLPWLLLSVAPGIVACHVILIVPEERFLAAKFGDDFRSYERSVGRWIG
jgi:protein-S-isoprenylcysteine O-methyltransferase Ste14